MTLTVSTPFSSSEVRHNKKLDRKCADCDYTFKKGEPYVHSVIFPIAYGEWDFMVKNWCFYCLPEALWSRIYRKMMGDEEENRNNHSQREHDINVYNFGACDDDAHDPEDCPK